MVELADIDEPWLTRLDAAAGSVLRFSFPAPSRVLGAYYAGAGALVRLNQDVVVLLGAPSGDLAADATDLTLRELAERVDASVGDVAPSKRLADELEVLHAVRAVQTLTADDLPATLEHIVRVAAESLSCEVGLLRDGAGRLAVTSSWSGVDPADQGVMVALDALHEPAAGGSLCIQDTAEHDVLAPLGRAQGVHSLLAVTVPDPVGGLLVVAHTRAGPRGFTGLCQQLGRQIADAASLVAQTAALRDELRAAAVEQSLTARRDSLTGLGNRLAWDEALVRAQELVDAGAPATVLTVDVDGLKHVNDTAGHAAGDDLLRRCADVLRQEPLAGELVVRVGGDEFALLLPYDGAAATGRLQALRDRLGSARSCEDVVAASVGLGCAGPDTSLADAIREADAAMYAAKRERRAAGRVPVQASRT